LLKKKSEISNSLKVLKVLGKQEAKAQISRQKEIRKIGEKLRKWRLKEQY
jgi:hypothetical protein